MVSVPCAERLAVGSSLHRHALRPPASSKQREMMYLCMYIYKSNIFDSPRGGNELSELICLHTWHNRL